MGINMILCCGLMLMLVRLFVVISYDEPEHDLSLKILLISYFVRLHVRQYYGFYSFFFIPFFILFHHPLFVLLLV